MESDHHWLDLAIPRISCANFIRLLHHWSRITENDGVGLLLKGAGSYSERLLGSDSFPDGVGSFKSMRSGSSPDLEDLTHNRVGSPQSVGPGSSTGAGDNDWIRPLPTGPALHHGLWFPTRVKLIRSGSQSNRVGPSKIIGFDEIRNSSAAHPTDPDRPPEPK